MTLHTLPVVQLVNLQAEKCQFTQNSQVDLIPYIPYIISAQTPRSSCDCTMIEGFAH